MARSSYKATLRTALGNGAYSFESGAAVGQASQAAVEAAVVVLEADGASPTQAHVVALRAAWDAYVTAAGVYGGADVILDINTATVTNQNAVQAALRSLTRVVAGSGLATG